VWLRRLTKFYHYHYFVVAIGLFIATVSLGEPGTHELVLGPVRVDAFWASIASSVVLFALSITERYDPAEYGLDPEE
jgi:choline-glycine betaine transporter